VTEFTSVGRATPRFAGAQVDTGKLVWGGRCADLLARGLKSAWILGCTFCVVYMLNSSFGVSIVPDLA
jgi:hypothetical protein